MDAGGRIRDFFVRRIVGLDDTPHRIAWGVFLGCVVGATPTLGFQIVIYLLVATLLRANKLSGLPIVFVTNPVTAVPLYYFAWRFGAWLLGSKPQNAARTERAMEELAGTAGGGDWTRGVFTQDFWERVLNTILGMGIELWVGCIILGVAFGIPAYALTYRAVVQLRAAKEARERREAEQQQAGHDAPHP
ncbi:MAG: DUF2062 domain-containing protein [Polyangiales bacterium]|nr:DUF2062 domain-containing protein [Myxococcales bacterium]